MEIPEKYKQIYEIISNGPIHINDICKKVNQNIAQVTTTLTILELEDLIQQTSANQFEIKEK